MFNPLSQEQQAELRGLIEKHGLQSVEAQLMDGAQNKLLLVPGSDAEPKIGQTRLGGLPDVPPDWEWPEGLLFIGQINLADAAPYDYNNLLPSQGLLSFFLFDDFREESSPGLPHQIYHFEGDFAEFAEAPAPQGYLPISLVQSTPADVVYNPRKMKIENQIEMAVNYLRPWDDHWGPKEGEVYDDAANNALTRELNPQRVETDTKHHKSYRSGAHHLFGHHARGDGNVDEEAWSAVHGVSVRWCHQEISAAEKAETLARFEQNIRKFKGDERMVAYFEKQKRDYLNYLEHKDEIDADLGEWVLLFHVDSDEQLGTQFNDAGIAYFMIRKSDLAAARFDRTYAGMWSS